MFCQTVFSFYTFIFIELTFLYVWCYTVFNMSIFGLSINTFYNPCKLCLWVGIMFSWCPAIRPSDHMSVPKCVCGWVLCFHGVRPSDRHTICLSQSVFVGGYYVFIVFLHPTVRPYVHPSKVCLWTCILFSRLTLCPSVIFCFLNNLKSDWLNFIKPCIHIPI